MSRFLKFYKQPNSICRSCCVPRTRPVFVPFADLLRSQGCLEFLCGRCQDSVVNHLAEWPGASLIELMTGRCVVAFHFVPSAKCKAALSKLNSCFAEVLWNLNCILLALALSVDTAPTAPLIFGSVVEAKSSVELSQIWWTIQNNTEGVSC